MTQTWRLLQELLDTISSGLSRLAALVWPNKHLHHDRFATNQEVKTLTHPASIGLVLGLDRFDRLLSVEATEKRPHLGHLAIFGPTGSGKTTREEEQLRRWKGQWERSRTLEETIRVKGGPPVTRTIRFTRNGPIVTEVLPAATRDLGPVSLKWLGSYRGGWLTALEVHTGRVWQADRGGRLRGGSIR